ncbi:MAG: FAD:protein FMN transferase [Candidatus Latescibacterota bacterium]|nr:MAG: FAD:protein FMN transferase [Candidatus Latescibacterota bacterium]
MRFVEGCAILLSMWVLSGDGPGRLESSWATGSDSVRMRDQMDSSRGSEDEDPLDSPVSAAGWCEERRWVMGTQLRVVIVSGCAEIREVMDAVFDEAKRWDALLSNYDPTSSLSQINANAGEFVPIPKDLYQYLERAKNDAEQTDGIFDITIGPLVGAHREGIAGADELADILEDVGIDKLEVRADEHGYYARLARPGMALDPGGDGKGVAVDAMVNKLREAGVTRALIDFGGSTYYGLGTPRAEKGWTIAVSGEDGEILGTVVLKDRALSVSASSHRNLDPVEEGGSKMPAGHILDPRTGSLIVDTRTAVVVSVSGTAAEVLSTVLVVTGKKGLEFGDRFRHTAAAVFEPAKKPASSGEFKRYFDRNADFRF